MRTIETSITFSVPAKILYNAFLDSRDLSKMILSPAEISPVVGGEFKLFNGGVTGSIVKLEPESRILEKWRFSQWSEGVFSDLELSFTSIGAQKTRLHVKQTNIPEKDAHGNLEQDSLVLNGWKGKFFVGIEKVLGFPVDRD